MLKKLITATAVALLVGAGLTACSTPSVDTPTPAPVDKTEEVKVVVPAEDFIEFDGVTPAEFDGVPVTCDESDGASASSARVTVVDSSTANAVQGETTHFTVECAYPVTDEIMDAIREVETSQQ